jgi:hypothetical protein
MRWRGGDNSTIVVCLAGLHNKQTFWNQVAVRGSDEFNATLHTGPFITSDSSWM